MTDRRSAAPAVSAGELEKAAGTRVFFGHQSVGQNVLDGVRKTYAANHLPAPAVEDALIGENENPLLKIKDFDATIRAGMGEEVDVAMMKLCYIDITTETDVGALFSTYRTTMEALGRDFPRVRFLHVTVPLMTEWGPLAAVKARLTGSTRCGPGENVKRERLNALIRREYADDRLFDLAAVESTTPAGDRVGGHHDGSEYYALYSGYASDNGHLNETGAQVAAAAWITSVAQAGGQQE